MINYVFCIMSIILSIIFEVIECEKIMCFYYGMYNMFQEVIVVGMLGMIIKYENISEIYILSLNEVVIVVMVSVFY